MQAEGMWYIVLIMAVVDGHGSSVSELQCSNQSTKFTEQPSNEFILCGTNDTAHFPCNFDDRVVPPDWKIDSTTYTVDKLPHNHVYTRRVLTVTNISYSQNNTLYQCIVTTRENCRYYSSIGKLIVKYAVISVPYYHYDSQRHGALKKIVTNFTALSNPGITYNVTYLDPFSDKICGLATIDSSLCVNGTCTHTFFTSSSCCLDSQYISVSIRVTESAFPLEIFDTLKIETINNFVRVNFDRNNQQFRCHFTDTNISAKKVCKVYYGPESLGCKSLPYYSEADISNSNLVGGGIRREIGNISKVCFSLEASDGSKTAFIEGIYDMDEASTSSSNILLLGLIAGAIIITFIALASKLLCTCFYCKHSTSARSKTI